MSQDFEVMLNTKMDNLINTVNEMKVSLAGKCAKEEQRLCRAEQDIDRAFVKIRGNWGWIVGGTGFITVLLSFFYFMLRAIAIG